MSAISKQRIIVNALRGSEFDLAEWPEDTLSNLADLIVAALRTAEFIQTDLSSAGDVDRGIEIDRLRWALEFYANPYTYTVTHIGKGEPFGILIEKDKGERAREALVGLRQLPTLSPSR